MPDLRSNPEMSSGFKPLAMPATHVEVDVESDVLAQMVARVDATFARLGEDEPNWAVITHEKFRRENFDANRAEFFETGRRNALLLQRFAERAAVDIGSYRHCVELGCGTGRVTMRLAEMFENVTAIDISPSMLRHARENAATFGHDNISFLRLERLSQLAELRPFEVFFSTIVLQHNPPPVQRQMLRHVLSRLSPGGIAFFQVPTYKAGYRFEATTYLASRQDLDAKHRGIEMHFLPQRVVFETLDEANCVPLEVREDGAPGPVAEIISQIFFVRKCG